MKRVISLLLSIVMVISMLPVSVFATDIQPEDPTMPESAFTSADAGEPVPDESEPAPSESEPVPSESEPAPSESEPAPSESAPAPEQKVELRLSTMTETAVADADIGDSGELLDGFMYKLFYGDDMSVYGNAAGNRLSPVPKKLYAFLKSAIEEIVSGEADVCSTVFTLDQEMLRESGVTMEASFDGTQAGLDAVMPELYSQFWEETEYAAIVDALLYDCAYELFWFDKTTPYGISASAEIEDSDTVVISELVLTFRVVEDMQATGYTAENPKVDVSKAVNAQEALENAQEVLARYQNKTDYEKLQGFKNEICSRVSYDFDALENGVFSLDADPWQLISVFDNSTATNVVCEGYSKAFQYLCERSGLESYLVTGYMDNDPDAGHMWNVVTLDGKNYIADITNVDDGMAGDDGSLFLNGYDDGSLVEGYVFDTQSPAGINIFTYDADTMNVWGTEILTLSAEDYTVPEDDGGEDGGEVDLNDWNCGENLSWNYDEDTCTLTISGTGAMTDYSTGGQPWASVMSDIRHLVIEDGVTQISKKAFHSLYSLEKITVPGELKTWNCITVPSSAPYETMILTGETVAPCDASTTGYMPGRNAANVVISEGITVISKGAFVNCDKIQNLSLPSTLQTIGESAFMQNVSLQSLSVPKNVTELQYAAFAGCTGLTTVIFAGDAPAIGEHAFFDVTAIVGYPGANETWTDEVMQDYQGNLTWKPYFKTLASGSCGPTMSYNLKDDGVLTLSGYGDMDSFAIVMAPWCTNELSPYVKRVVVEEGITGIGHTAFAGCTALEEISFAATVASIDPQAFYGCTALKKIEFTGDRPAIGDNAFYGVQATATYPATNSTWLEEELENYGGTLNWEAVRLSMSQEDFQAAVADAEDTYVLTRDVTITGDVVMNKPVTIAEDAILTVAEGAHLGIAATAWSVEGALVNEGVVDLTGGAVLTIESGSYANENSGTFHVGMKDDQAGTLELRGIFGGPGYLCVHPAGTVNIDNTGYMGINAQDDKEGFLQCNGTVNVYGGLDIGGLFVVDTTSEITATLNIKESGLFYNYEGAESAIEADGVLNLEGEMFNASTFVIRGTATITGTMYSVEGGDLRIEGSGSVENNGTIEGDVHVGHDAELTGSGVVTGEIDKVDRTSHDWFVQKLENARDGYLFIQQDVVLVEDVTIPGTVGCVAFDGASLTIPNGVTLTSYASMGFKDGLHVEEGGALNLLSDGTSADINDDGWLLSWSEYEAPVIIDGALTIGEGASLCAHNAVTVSESGNVTVNGSLSLEAYSHGGSDWDVDGTMQINGMMSVHKRDASEFSKMNLNEGSTLIASRDSFVYVGGALYVNGTVKNSGWMEANEGGELFIGENGHLTNDNYLFFNDAKTVVVNGTLVNDLVEGQFEDGQGIHLVRTGMDIYGTLTSCNDIYVDGGPEKPLTICEGAELSLVPKGENYYGGMYIYSESSVEVLGTMTNNGLIMNWGGTIWVDENGSFTHNMDMENYGNIHVGMNNGGTVELNARLDNNGYLCVHPQGVLNIQENGVLANHYLDDETGGYLDVQGTVNVYDKGMIDSEYLVTVDGEMNIHQGGELVNRQAERGSDYGTVLINESGRLTVEGRLTNNSVFVSRGDTTVNGGELYVGTTGHLINNAELNLRNATVTVEGTLTNGGEDAPELMSLWANYGTVMTVNGKLINNRNIHVGIEPGRSALLTVDGTLTNNAYICVHPEGVLHVGTEGALTNTFKEGVNTGFLQVNGEVVVDGVINNSFMIVAGSETVLTEAGIPGQTGVLTIGSNGVVNNKYVNPELAEITVLPNGKMNLAGKIKNDSRLINTGVIQAQESGSIVSGTKAVFENEGELVVGENAEAFNVVIQSDAEELTLQAKKTLKLEALLLPGNVTNTKVVWSVSDPLMATLKTIGNTVILTAADVSEPQTITLTAASADGLAVADTVTVHIIPEVKQIDIYQFDYNVSDWGVLYYSNVDYSFTTELSAVAEPAGASAEVIWSTDNEKIGFFADETQGTLTLTGAEGSVKVTATSVSNSKVKATVTYKLVAPVTTMANDNAEVDASGNRTLKVVAGKSETLQILDADTGKKMTVQWSFGFQDGYVWHDTSLDAAMYATISSSGKLTAKKVSSYQELTLRGQVMKNDVPVEEIFYTVKIYPATVYVDIRNADQVVNGQTLYLDQSNTAGLNLNAAVYPVDAWKDVIWDSSNDNIATVVNGVVKPGTKTGTVTITATNNDGIKKKATVKVEVGALTQSVTIVNAPATLLSGASFTLKAETIPAEPTKAGVTWQIIEGADYAKIASSGKLTAKTVTAPQIVKVVAISKDAAQIESAPVEIIIMPKAAENLNLLNAATGANVTKATLNAEIGDEFTVTAKKYFSNTVESELWGVTWSVKGGDVALTDADGNRLEDDLPYNTVKIKVNGTGKATITATGYNTDGAEVTATVIINAGVLSDGVRLISGGSMVASGQNITLKAEAYRIDGQKLTNSKLTWSLAEGDEAYAKISTSGKLTAVKNLTTRKNITVIVTAQDGNSEPLEIPVTITPLAQSVELYMNHTVPNGDGTAVTYHYAATGQNWLWAVFPGEEVSVKAVVYPAEGAEEVMANQTVEWKSSNEKILKIDPETGAVTFGEKTGSVTITATAQDGSKKKATFKLTVIRPVLELKMRDGSVVGGKTLKLDTLMEYINPDATSKKLVYEVTGGDGEAFVTLSKNQLKTKKVTGVKEVYITAYDEYYTAYADFAVYIRPSTTQINLTQPEETAAVTQLPQGQALRIAANSLPVYDLPIDECFTWKISNAKQGGFVTESGELVGSIVAPYVDLVGTVPGSALTVTATAMDGSGMKATMKINVVQSDIVELTMIAAQYGPDTAEWWVDFEQDFEAANEKIDLTVDVVSWNDIYTVIDTRLSNGNAPDILNIDILADFQADGLLLPVEDYISEETYAKFYPQMLEEARIDGTVWAVPDLTSTRALYYNTDIFDALGIAPPTTWDDLVTACREIREAYPDVAPLGVDMSDDEGQLTFALYAWNNGGGFTDASGNWKLDTEANAEAIDFLAAMHEMGYTTEDPTKNDRYELREMFSNGQVAMTIQPDSFNGIYGEEMHVNYDVTQIPLNIGNSSISAAVMDRMMCFDNGHSAEELAAIQTFFDFFYEDDRYSDWTAMEGFLPATSTGCEALAQKDPEQAVWGDILENCRLMPTGKDGWQTVRDGVIRIMKNALEGENIMLQLEELQAQVAG